MKKKLTVAQMFYEQRENLRLKAIHFPEQAAAARIKVPDINRPGLALVGYFDYFDFKRIQIIGRTEMSYLDTLSESKQKACIQKFLTYKIPCIIFSRNMKVSELFMQEVEKQGIVVLKSSLATTRLIGKLTMFLEDWFAPHKTVHGTLMDVHGVGVLLFGRSGVGKSECALELVERGHRLVADDVVMVKKRADRFLMGTGTNFIKHHMEIRGLGIIDVKSIYGASSVRNQKRIGLTISLEDWEEGKNYERLGMREQLYTLLGISLPHYVVPVKPGRNIAVLIEVAASTQRLRRMGFNPVAEIEKKMLGAVDDGVLSEFSAVDEMF